MIIGIETSMKNIQQKHVIGIVASTNSDFTKYSSHVDIRDNNDTNLSTLSKIIKLAIYSYYKNTENLPNEIIIYR